MMNFFTSRSRPESKWFYVGRASSFPDILGPDDGDLAQSRPCGTAEPRPGCRVFHVPKADGTAAAPGDEVTLVEDNDNVVGETQERQDLKDQVLVFKYRGKLHAVDHQCPHSSFPLSRGLPFDIEDFGIVLSAGLTCPKHGWSFDIFSGMSDRGRYKLGVWEIRLADVEGGAASTPPNFGVETSLETADQEVWVRRKQRIG